jgi:hypothetical protein
MYLWYNHCIYLVWRYANHSIQVHCIDGRLNPMHEPEKLLYTTSKVCGDHLYKWKASIIPVVLAFPIISDR